MKIKSLVVENFRPYYGNQKVVFSDTEKNITIFFGDNGSGKSSLYRAIVFALFGNEYIELDEKGNPLQLVNKKLTEENEGVPVDAISEVKFEHNQIIYTIRRTMQGIWHAGEQKEKVGSVSMTTIDSEGNALPTPITDEDEIAYTVNNIISSQMRDFFFFDGERIDTLTTTTQSKRNAVRDAISTVTQINDLEDSLSILRTVKRDMEQEQRNKSQSHNLKKKMDMKHEKEEKSEGLKADIIKLEQEVIQIGNEIKNINELINSDEKASYIRDTANIKKELLKSHEENYKNKSKSILRSVIKTSPLLLLEPYHETVSSYLQTRYESENHIIPIPLIDKSILEKTCACCGLSLEEHLEALQGLEAKRENYKHNNLNEFVSVIKSHYNNSNVGMFIESLKEYQNEEFKRRSEIQDVEKQIDIQEKKLVEIDSEIENMNKTVKNLKNRY